MEMSPRVTPVCGLDCGGLLRDLSDPKADSYPVPLGNVDSVAAAAVAAAAVVAESSAAGWGLLQLGRAVPARPQLPVTCPSVADMVSGHCGCTPSSPPAPV